MPYLSKNVEEGMDPGAAKKDEVAVTGGMYILTRVSGLSLQSIGSKGAHHVSVTCQWSEWKANIKKEWVTVRPG